MKIGPFWHVYDGCIYYREQTLEDGFYCRQLKKLSLRNGSITEFYQPAGNLSGYYPLVDKALLEQGYYLTELTYYEGILTGFYVQRDIDSCCLYGTEQKVWQPTGREKFFVYSAACNCCKNFCAAFEKT